MFQASCREDNNEEVKSFILMCRQIREDEEQKDRGEKGPETNKPLLIIKTLILIKSQLEISRLRELQLEQRVASFVVFFKKSVYLA